MLTGGTDNVPSEDEIFIKLRQLVETGEVEEENGFYCLSGRREIIERRLANYPFYLERVIRAARLIKWVKYIPYIRSVLLSGSTAGMHGGPKSDIDFIVIVKPGRIWIARLLLTGFMQFLGVRRYGDKITDRICLSHYIVDGESFETRYRPLDYATMLCMLNFEVASAFLARQKWLQGFLQTMPEMPISVLTQTKSAILQPLLELIFEVLGAKYWDKLARFYQKNRIKPGVGIFISDNELAFHPTSKRREIYAEFEHKIKELGT